MDNEDLLGCTGCMSGPAGVVILMLAVIVLEVVRWIA